jgi:transcriptional regulator of heat shock response
MRFRKMMQLLKYDFIKLMQLLKMELRKLMKFLHNNFRRLMKLKKPLEKYLKKLTKLEAFIGEGSFKSSTAETISKAEVDATNILSELQFDEQEIVLKSDMGNDPLSSTNQDMHDVAKILALNLLSVNTTTKKSDEDELTENQAGFVLNVEEFS